MSKTAQNPTSPKHKNRRILILLFILCVALFLWSASADGLLTTRTEKPPIVPLGTVQKVTYLKTLRHFTQIDTERNSLLLRDVSRF
jgi:hypothetical protein